MSESLRLHVGGKIPKEGWKIFSIQPGPNVDYVGNCLDLSQFADNSVTEIYASHVLEHLNYHDEIRRALQGFRRVLQPGGRIMIGVPDLDTLCSMLLAPYFNAEVKYFVMSMITVARRIRTMSTRRATISSS
jgi:predicted SAM-dependent methyltransferase